MEYIIDYMELPKPEELNTHVWIPALIEDASYQPSDESRLRRQGWKTSKILMAHIYALGSQYAIMRGVIDPTQDEYDEQGHFNQKGYSWFRKKDIAFVERYPVIFPILTETDDKPARGYNALFGAVAFFAKNGEGHMVQIQQLSEEARTLCYHIHERMQTLEASTDSDKTPLVEEIHGMVQELAKAYYTLLPEEEVKLIEPNPQALPPIKSTDKSRLPSSNHFRAMVQGYGSGYIRMSLWNSETSDEQQLTTPNGSMLRVRGQEDYEKKALHTYITTMMGTEGLKALLTVIDAYYIQTGARAQHINARMSLRQLMLRMNYSEAQADDLNERRKMAHTILYFARTWVTSPEKKFVPQTQGRGRKKRTQDEYSPLLVIEKIRSSPDGGLDVPDEIKYHLGEDYYESLFGVRPQYFALPTAQVLSYHAVRQQQEICLAFYLSNMVTLNKSCPRHFHELLLTTGLMTMDAIAHDPHRTRNALRVMYAFEQLEKDGFICRATHDDIDIALAVELFLGACEEDKDQSTTRTRIRAILLNNPSLLDNTSSSCRKIAALIGDSISYTMISKHVQMVKDAVDKFSQTTFKRLLTTYAYIQQLPVTEQRTKRRIALQRLLKESASPAIVFTAGPLLKENAEKLEAIRQNAIIKNERSQIARVIKIAKAELEKEVKATDKSQK